MGLPYYSPIDPSVLLGNPLILVEFKGTIAHKTLHDLAPPPFQIHVEYSLAHSLSSQQSLRLTTGSADLAPCALAPRARQGQ